MRKITCVSPVNIAVIKYWGKRDENLILPINDSISTTLSTDTMCSKTTVMISPRFTDNKFWLNGVEEYFNNIRLLNCLEEVKKRSKCDPELLKWNIHICSENNFPTAAGLASSAAGYSCLVFALAQLYEIHGDISEIARRGSGSACRSIYGGWVQWHMGSLNDGSDSIATPIAPSDHWPEVRILILVVNDSRKKHSSTSAMKRGVQTSALLKYRSEIVVPRRVAEMKDAISRKDFHKFAELTMRDSNQFHAICLDTFPPCVYMSEVSHAIVELVHAYNQVCGTNKVAYTFDAGPNACLYMRENDVSEVFSLLNEVFPTMAEENAYLKGPAIKKSDLNELTKQLNLEQQKPDCLKYVIHTSVGDGPQVLTAGHLLDDEGYLGH